MSGSTTPATPNPAPVSLGQAYGRFVNLVLTDREGNRLEVSELKLNFDVQQFDNQTPNTMDVTIYNMAESTSSKITREYEKVVLWAGYESNLGPIFEGTVRQYRRGRINPTDTYFNLRCSDGDIAYTQSTINVTLASGATAEDAVAAVLIALAPQGITRGYIAPLPPYRTPRAVTFSGMTRDVLRDLAQNWVMSWSIQNNKLVILPLDGSGLPDPPIILNSGSGLIGMPQQTLEGIMVRCLLNPQIKIGRILKIDNTSIQQGKFDLAYTGEVKNEFLRNVRIADDGLYRTLAVNHIGDTRDNDWYSDVICIAVGSDLPIASAQRGRV